MKPIRLVSWREDFIAALADHLAHSTVGDLSRALVLVPHARPVRFLKARFAAMPDLPRPCLLPRMIAFDDFIDQLVPDLRPAHRRRIGLLDQVGVLFDVVARVRETRPGPLAALPLDRCRFLPWGVRLAKLLEELNRQGLTGQNLHYLSGEVIPWAAALLEQLGDIHGAFAAELEERGLTTFGLDCRLAAANPDLVRARTAGFSVFLAGFYALGGAEDAVFRQLWEQGAEVLWHGDPALVLGGPVHPCEAEHLAWKKRWGAEVSLLGSPGRAEPPRASFVEGFDLHSQLTALRTRLAALPPGESAAVVLPETGLLTPVLHHLPDLDVNISMGYPLDRSALAGLLETVLALREGRDARGRHPRQALIALLRHPYLRMTALSRFACLRPVFQQWEASIRESGPLADPRDFLPVYEDLPEDESEEAAENLRREILARCLDAFAGVDTLEGLGLALAALARFLAELGGGVWRNYLIDAECLARLTGSVVPQLTGCLVSRDPYPLPVLLTVFRQLLASERVSFEPEPLTGLQVLGFLETRLLTFRRLFVLEAVEEVLPGSPAYEPLLPDPLRGLLSLPDSRERDHVAAYNFHRLVQGAEEAVIFYQAGVKPGLLDSKSARSRYVEELIWDLEKRSERLLRRGDPELAVVTFPACPPDPRIPDIPRSGAAQARILERLSKGLSPSALDAYLRCPKAFFYRQAASLRPARPAPGEADQSRVGLLLHAVLEEFFTPLMDRPLDLAALPAAERAALARQLAEIFDRHFEEEDFFRHLPHDRRACLAFTGRERLARCLDNLPPTRVIRVETELKTELSCGDLAVTFQGRADRLDLREEGAVLLDYKTGRVRKPAPGFWEDGDLWEELAAWTPQTHGDADGEADLLARLAAGVGSVQLPAYLLLCRQNPPGEGREVLQAAWVELADKGAEVPLFPARLPLAERREIVGGRVPALLDFLLRHLLGCTRFVPAAGPGCAYCEYRGPCGAGTRGGRS